MDDSTEVVSAEMLSMLTQVAAKVDCWERRVITLVAQVARDAEENRRSEGALANLTQNMSETSALVAHGAASARTLEEEMLRIKGFQDAVEVDLQAYVSHQGSTAAVIQNFLAEELHPRRAA